MNLEITCKINSIQQAKNVYDILHGPTCKKTYKCT